MYGGNTPPLDVVLACWAENSTKHQGFFDILKLLPGYGVSWRIHGAYGDTLPLSKRSHV